MKNVKAKFVASAIGVPLAGYWGQYTQDHLNGHWCQSLSMAVTWMCLFLATVTFAVTLSILAEQWWKGAGS